MLEKGAEIFLPDAEATRAAGRRLSEYFLESHRDAPPRYETRGDETRPLPRLLTLRGDLGAGKTTLCQGLGEAWGAKEIVSPSFALANEYRGARGAIFHLDLYRLNSPNEFYEAGLDEYLSRPGLTVIEWPENLPPDFRPPGPRLDLSLTFKDQGRLLTRL